MSSITHIKNIYWERLAVVATATANAGKRLLKQPADAVSALGRRAKPGVLATIGLLLFFLIVPPLPGSRILALFRNLRHLFCSLGNQGRAQALRRFSLGNDQGLS